MFPGAAGQGPARHHLPPAGLRCATSSLRVRVRVRPLCNQQTVLHRTQANTDGMADGNRETGQSEDRQSRRQRTLEPRG